MSVTFDSTSDFLIHDDKIPTPGYVYYKQPYSLQIIQLVECPAPPPRQISSPSAASSSCSSSSSAFSSEYDSTEDDETCSSYCSSDLPPEEFDDPVVVQAAATTSLETGGDVRMKRILAWRENFSAAMSTTLSDSSPLKRKYREALEDEDDDDTMSHSSKRSRLSERDEDEELSIVSFGEHSCPACDASFPTRQSLRQHGLDAAKSNEACSVAVEYAFE